MQLLFCCWEHLAVDTEVVPAGNTNTLSFSGEAGLGDLPDPGVESWGIFSACTFPLTIHLNAQQIFVCSPAPVLQFLHYDSFPNMMKVHVSCLPKPPLQSSQWGCDGQCAVWITGRVFGSLTQWLFLCWADSQYLVSLIYLKSAKLGWKC